MNNPSNTARMLLIGGLRLGRSAPGDYSFYGDLFARLPKEARNTGDPTRYVAFDYLTEGEHPITFLGIQVDRIESIPTGMMAWDIDGNRLTVLEQQNGEDTIIWQQRLDWEWRDFGSSTSGRGLTGEFSIIVPADWTGTTSPKRRLFSMTANCYIAPSKGGCNDAIHLVDYDPTWPEQFDKFSAWLRDCLGPDVALRVEHFGSTAIPGMVAKPIIDVLVQVPSFMEAKRRALPVFNNESWEYWWHGDHPMFVKRDGFMGTRTHHVHMMVEGPELRKRLAFRDYLRVHSEDAAQYAGLKHQLAVCHRDDREKYTDAKAAFVNEIATKT